MGRNEKEDLLHHPAKCGGPEGSCGEGVAAMSPDFISSSCQSSIPKIKKMLEAEGGHFET